MRLALMMRRGKQEVAPQLGSVERRVVRVALPPSEAAAVAAVEDDLRQAEAAVEGTEASDGQKRRLRGLALQLWQARGLAKVV